MAIISGKLKKILLMGIGVIVLVSTLAGAFMFGKGRAPKSLGKTQTPAMKEVVQDATGSSESKDKTGEAKTGEAKTGDPKEGGTKVSGQEGPPSKKDLTFQFEKPFVVNLIDPKGFWFIQTGIKIEAGSLSQRAEIEDNLAPLTDATIMLLSSKRKEDFDMPEGKDRLKRELRARYEGIVDPHSIKNIYFDNFQVLRSR